MARAPSGTRRAITVHAPRIARTTAHTGRRVTEGGLHAPAVPWRIPNAEKVGSRREKVGRDVDASVSSRAQTLANARESVCDQATASSRADGSVTHPVRPVPDGERSVGGAEESAPGAREVPIDSEESAPDGERSVGGEEESAPGAREVGFSLRESAPSSEEPRSNACERDGAGRRYAPHGRIALLSCGHLAGSVRRSWADPEAVRSVHGEMRASSTAGQRRWRARSGLALATCAAAVAVTGCRWVARDTGGRTITNPTPVVVAPPVDAGRITDYFEIDDAGHPLFGARAPPSRPRPFREITLRFAPGGALILAGVPTTLAALPEAPAPYVTVHPEWVDVTLIASTKRPYAQVRDVLTVLRKAGLERVVLDATD